MKTLFLVAGASALAFAAPVAAKGHAAGHGHGHAHAQTHAHAHAQTHGMHSAKVYRGRAAANMWGANACPPGLAKKNNGCLPPGIAKQRFHVGDRWTGNYGSWTYNQVPVDWRSQYNLDPNNRYYYRDGYLYSVDPKTRLVEAIIQALIR